MIYHHTKQEFKSFFRSGSLLSNLILINTSVWIALMLLRFVLYLLPPGPEIYHKSIGILGISPKFSEFIRHPWGIFTYLFTHTEFFHLAFNMLTLYFSGILFCQYLGEKIFAQTFFIGGLSGGFCFILSNLIPLADEKYTGMVIGASPAVLAVLCRLAAAYPNKEFLIFKTTKLKFKYLAPLILAIDILSINGDNSGGFTAHLCGAVYGYLTVYFPFFFKKSDLKIQTFFLEKKIIREKANQKRNNLKKNQILKKISTGGYSNLSNEEKEFLFKK